MLTDRILPFEEWDKLQGMDLARVVSQLNPDSTQVLVVEDETGRVVGCWALMPLLHAEGLWIDPAHRGHPSVARHLWSRLRATVAALGGRAIITGSADDRTTAMLRKRGQALPQEYLLCLL